MKKIILFFLILILLLLLSNNKLKELFTNIYIVDPNKDLNQRYLDHFHYGIKYINLPHLNYPPIYYPQYLFHNPHRIKYPFYNYHQNPYLFVY